jgi:hypothetical protein
MDFLDKYADVISIATTVTRFKREENSYIIAVQLNRSFRAIKWQIDSCWKQKDDLILKRIL